MGQGLNRKINTHHLLRTLALAYGERKRTPASPPLPPKRPAVAGREGKDGQRHCCHRIHSATVSVAFLSSTPSLAVPPPPPPSSPPPHPHNPAAQNPNPNRRRTPRDAPDRRRRPPRIQCSGCHSAGAADLRCRRRDVVRACGGGGVRAVPAAARRWRRGGGGCQRQHGACRAVPCVCVWLCVLGVGGFVAVLVSDADGRPLPPRISFLGWVGGR